MEKVIYTPRLRKKLDDVKRTAVALGSEEKEKSREQFLAEVKFMKELLDEVKDLA